MEITSMIAHSIPSVEPVEELSWDCEAEISIIQPVEDFPIPQLSLE
jgi:hypothetical protein